MTDYRQLPSDLPVPQNDGAADHLPGAAMPPLRLRDTGGTEVALDQLGPGRTVIYLYPLSGRPGDDLPTGWDAIPGARGCTPEACGFRDHHGELQAAGAHAVYGLSSQSTEYQAELARRLGLPFSILSDPDLALADALDLPTFEADGERLFSRLTLIVTDGRIEQAFYPVFPPDQHAAEVVAWLRPFVPDEFAVPRTLIDPRFRLEPLGPQHNAADHAAWTSSIDHVRATAGWEGSEWPPPEGMSPEENLRDLEAHAADFLARRGFTYTVLAPDGDVIGCVYIYPANDSEHDARVRSWVSAAAAELDAPLHAAVSRWLGDQWPFERVDYAERD